MAPATLNVTRESAGIELVRHPFDIVVDGIVAGSVAREGSVRLNIAPGQHTLRLRTGRRISPERSFDVAEGANVSFRCHGVLTWPVYVASLIKSDLSITLKQE